MPEEFQVIEWHVHVIMFAILKIILEKRCGKGETRLINSQERSLNWKGSGGESQGI